MITTMRPCLCQSGRCFVALRVRDAGAARAVTPTYGEAKPALNGEAPRGTLAIAAWRRALKPPSSFRGRLSEGPATPRSINQCDRGKCGGLHMRSDMVPGAVFPDYELS